MNGLMNLASIASQVTAPSVNPPIQDRQERLWILSPLFLPLPKKKAKSTSNKLHLNSGGELIDPPPGWFTWVKHVAPVLLMFVL